MHLVTYIPHFWHLLYENMELHCVSCVRTYLLLSLLDFCVNILWDCPLLDQEGTTPMRLRSICSSNILMPSGFYF